MGSFPTLTVSMTLLVLSEMTETNPGLLPASETKISPLAES